MISIPRLYKIPPSIGPNIALVTLSVISKMVRHIECNNRCPVEKSATTAMFCLINIGTFLRVKVKIPQAVYDIARMLIY